LLIVDWRLRIVDGKYETATCAVTLRSRPEFKKQKSEIDRPQSFLSFAINFTNRQVEIGN
jgi:hypothetical protein